MLSTALYAGASYGQTATAPASAPIGISQIAQAAQVAQTTTQTAVDNSEIIVTGTRESNQTARESPTPIAVISAEALAATGATNVFDALLDLDPSVTSQAIGADTSQLVRSLRLRGLSTGQLLILIDGKRRHVSAQLNPDPGLDQGSTPVDLDFIPVAAIDHLEILRDGAGAQYGSDAIAGVINIILKHDDSGTEVSVLGGASSRRDDGTVQLSGNQGVALDGGGFINISADYRHQEFTNRSGLDQRPGADFVLDRVFGGPKYDTESVAVNFEAPWTNSITAYGNATFGHRDGEAFENFRRSFVAPAIWPNGFFPEEASNEYDTAFTLGVRGKDFLGFNWDLSTTYGNDWFQLHTINSANPNLYLLSGDTQTNFTDGENVSTELTTTLDFKRDFNIGLAAPLNVAFGFEERLDQYEIDAGQPASYLYGGSQSEPGFTTTDAGQSHRTSQAVYVELATHLLPDWKIDVAGRAENFDDIGASETGKFSTRYDFGKWFGVRMSAGTGFHAPTLAQEHFSFTNVGPGYVDLQLPVDSPGGVALGAPPLKPETSNDISVGFLSEPIPRLTLSVDAYQIQIQNRIIDSALVQGAPAVAAFEANGGSLPSDVTTSEAFAQYFTNAGDTRTKGVDFKADYRFDLPPQYGTLRLAASGTVSYTTVTSENNPNLFNEGNISELTTANPHSKMTLAAFWHYGDWAVVPRVTRYGATLEYSDPSGGNDFQAYTTDTTYVFDLDIGYQITDYLKVNLGSTNLFDAMPAKLNAAQSGAAEGGTGAQQYPGATPWGLLGEFSYLRLSASF
jgi:iron complex outermembrane receptor protein